MLGINLFFRIIYLTSIFIVPLLMSYIASAPIHIFILFLIGLGGLFILIKTLILRILILTAIGMLLFFRFMYLF